MSEDYMGTHDEAQAKCLEAWKRWCTYRQPHIGTAAEHRRRDAEEREALSRFAQAAALLCWHIEQAQIVAADEAERGAIDHTTGQPA